MKNRKAFNRQGFTLIELLVVIGILAILAAILLPAVSHAWRTSEQNAERGDLATLATALAVYQSDFQDYPRNPILARDTTGNPAPFYSLAIALLGPGPKVSGNGKLGDGADGLGFRTILGYDSQTQAYDLPTGKVWGPYISADTFKVSWEVPAGQTLEQPMLLDRWKTPIQYFPRYGPVGFRKDTSLSTGGEIAGPLYGNSTAKSTSNAGQDTFFDSRDATSAWITSPTGSGTSNLALQWMLGDDNTDNFIDASESIHCTDPFVLISAGPDQKFCNLSGSSNDSQTFQLSGNVYSFTR